MELSLLRNMLFDYIIKALCDVTFVTLIRNALLDGITLKFNRIHENGSSDFISNTNTFVFIDRYE